MTISLGSVFTSSGKCLSKWSKLFSFAFSFEEGFTDSFLRGLSKCLLIVVVRPWVVSYLRSIGG